MTVAMISLTVIPIIFITKKEKEKTIQQNINVTWCLVQERIFDFFSLQSIVDSFAAPQVTCSLTFLFTCHQEEGLSVR